MSGHSAPRRRLPSSKSGEKHPNSLAAIRVEWIEMREECGSAEMRSQSIVLGLWCLEIYDILTANDAEFFSWWSYDWEVIPAMLKHAVCNDGKASMYRGDYVYMGGELIDPHSAAQLVAQEFAWLRFEDDCKGEARKQWPTKAWSTTMAASACVSPSSWARRRPSS